MSADDVAVLVAASAAALAALAALVAVVLLSRRVRDLRRLVDDLQSETVPLLRGARLVVEEAATEMVRVGDVLGSAESVSATVDSASRLAYRAFSNPVVKVVAYSTGAGAALRRLFGRSGPDNQKAGAALTPLPRPDTATVAGPAKPSARRHRRSRANRVQR
jgi:hypothetical protein